MALPGLVTALAFTAALSFLGLGKQPPTPEWGTMINEARPFFQRAPWQMLAPGLCIVITVLAVNLTGDALRDALDPRLRGSRVRARDTTAQAGR
jgi:ABC-type dipeptide/oligopeptide/nickel transport system permease subunit